MLQTKSLAQICTIKTGKLDVNHGSDDGIYPFFTCADKPSRSSTYSFDGESIVVPGNGSNVGMVLYHNGPCEAYQRTYVLQDFKAIPKYVYYHLKYLWRRRNAVTQYGSATNYIRISNFTSYQIVLPSRKEQERIVTILDKAQKLCQLSTKINDISQQLLRSTFHTMFGDPTKNPQKWPMMKIGECVNVQGGFAFKGTDYQDTGVSLVQISNVHHERLVWKKTSQSQLQSW